jgi:FKBP-type peptidyl-prolyl cis-trans isomerase SlpA
MSAAKKDNIVKVHYTGKLDSGQVFDSSKDREPLEFKIGEGKLIPGFENGVVGMKLQESKTIKIPFAEAYGEKKHELMIEVQNQQLPEELKPEVGMELVSKSPDGQEQIVKIAEVKEASIVVDANHPLAGQDLTFEIELVDIK